MDRAQEMIDEGYAARREGRLDVALTKYRDAAEALRGMDALLRLAHTVRHVADIERQMERFGEAEVSYAEALGIYRSRLDTGVLDLANTLRPYALLRESTGDLESARVMFIEARNLYASLNVQAGVDEMNRRLAQGVSE